MKTFSALLGVLLCLPTSSALASILEGEAADIYATLVRNRAEVRSYRFKITSILYLSLQVRPEASIERAVARVNKDRGELPRIVESEFAILTEESPAPIGISVSAAENGMRQDMSFSAGLREMIASNDQLRCSVSHQPRHLQLDIAPVDSQSNDKLWELSDLGVVLRDSPGFVLEGAKPDDDGWTFSFRRADDVVKSVSVNAKGGITRIVSARNGQPFYTAQFAGHREIDGFQVPRFLVESWPQDPTKIAAALVEDVRINVPVSSEDISLGEMRGPITVVDHRSGDRRVIRVDNSRTWELADIVHILDTGKLPGSIVAEPTFTPPEDFASSQNWAMFTIIACVAGIISLGTVVAAMLRRSK